MLLASELKKALALGVATPQDRPESTPNHASAGCNSQLAQYSNTPARNASRSDAGGPSLRVAGFEDEDEIEVPWIAPCVRVPSSRELARPRRGSNPAREGLGRKSSAARRDFRPTGSWAIHCILGQSIGYWLFPEDGLQVSNEDRLQLVSCFFLLFRGTGDGSMQEGLDQLD